MRRNLQEIQKKVFSQGIITQGLFCVLCVLGVLLLVSCGPEHDQETKVIARGFSQSHVQEPYTLKLRTDKKEMTIAGQVRLVLETSAPEGVEVRFPAFGAGLGDFTLVDTGNNPPRLTGTGENTRVVDSATYLLEPYLPGTYTIPEMTVKFTDRSTGEELTRLVTEELQVVVKSLLGKDTDSFEIKDIKGPFSLPENNALQILLIIFGLLLILLAIAGFFYWQKVSRSKETIEVQLRPEETALRELEKLLAENLLSRGEIKLFHLKISDILRHYIENRFGFKAAERTTEEFLTELSVAKLHGDSPLGSHKKLLADFLSHCDLVKFAKHEPTIAESEKTVSLCRQFIEATREKDCQHTKLLTTDTRGQD